MQRMSSDYIPITYWSKSLKVPQFHNSWVNQIHINMRSNISNMAKAGFLLLQYTQLTQL